MRLTALEGRDNPAITFGLNLDVVNLVNGFGVGSATITVADGTTGVMHAGTAGTTNAGGQFASQFTDPNAQEAMSETRTTTSYRYVNSGYVGSDVVSIDGQPVYGNYVSEGGYARVREEETIRTPAQFTSEYVVTVMARGYETQVVRLPINYDARALQGTIVLRPVTNTAQQPVFTEMKLGETVVFSSLGSGADAQLKGYTPSGEVRFSATPFPGFLGGVRVAAADITGDGILDPIAGAGPGGTSHVIAYNGATGAVIHSFIAFGSFGGGVNIAAGDVNGDGRADIGIAADATGAPHVMIIDGVTGATLFSDYVYDQGFVGGVRIAIGDLNGDGRGDLLTIPGGGGGSHLRGFDVSTRAALLNTFAYDPKFLGGSYIGAADLNNDGITEIVVGAGDTGGSHVLVLRANGSTISSFFAFPGFNGGVRVAAAMTIEGPRVFAGAGFRGGPHLKTFDMFGNDVGSFFVDTPQDAFLGGIYVGP